MSEPARRRRLLLVSYVFPPLVGGGAPRMGQFARLLPDHGWDVTAVTARHAASGIDSAAVEALAGRATIVEAWSPISAVTVRGKPAPKRGLRALSRRVLRTASTSLIFPDREVFWIPAAVAAGKKALAAQHHDAVLATHGPASNLVVGRILAKSARLPLVVDFRDLWSTLPMPIFPTRWHRTAARRLERTAVRAASKVIAVSPGMAAELASAHDIAVGDTVSITNGFDPADAARVTDRRSGPRPFRLLYAGSVNVHHNLEPFWRVLRRLADSGRITPETFRVEFVGNLALSDVRSHGLEAFVETGPFVPHGQIFDAFARADALMMIETPGYYAQFSYAAKLFDYLITGKPVLALVEEGGYSHRLLQDAGVGLFADQHDIESVGRAVEAVLALKDRPPRTVDVEAEPLRSFNRRHLVAKLAGVLDDVVAREPGGRW